MAGSDDRRYRAERIRMEAAEAGLIDAERLSRLSDDEILDNVNGIGCEAMPAPLRRALDSLHPCMVLPSVIHDLSWAFWCDGGSDDFLKSNAIFALNARIMCRHMYRWYNPRRWWELWRCGQYQRLLDAFGWLPYCNAFSSK